MTAIYTVAQPVVVDRLIALERGDYTYERRARSLDGAPCAGADYRARLHLDPLPGISFPGCIRTPPGLRANWMHTWTPRLTSELKLSYSDDNLWWDRAHPEIPTLASAMALTLPGSPAFYAYRNHNRTPEVIYSTVWTRNRHVITAGAGCCSASTAAI